MISKKDLINVAHNFWDDFIKSQKELFRDNKGGFLIPISAKVKDKEYGIYRHLPINWDIPAITKEHLPKEFSQNAVNTVDMFSRKTYDLNYECLIYFDIETGNIVFCSFSEKTKPNQITGFSYPFF